MFGFGKKQNPVNIPTDPINLATDLKAMFDQDLQLIMQLPEQGRRAVAVGAATAWKILHMRFGSVQGFINAPLNKKADYVAFIRATRNDLQRKGNVVCMGYQLVVLYCSVLTPFSVVENEAERKGVGAVLSYMAGRLEPLNELAWAYKPDLRPESKEVPNTV
jgi:hypothetical protein